MPIDVDDVVLDDAFAAWQQEALLLAGAATDAAVREAWDRAFREAAGSAPGRFDPEAQEFMRRYHFAAIRKITSEEKEVVRRVLLDAVRDGLGQDDAARALGVEFDARRSRLRAIARTELNRGANWGRLQGYIASGVVEELEWIATHDDRVRPDHLASDGNKTRLGEPFPGPGASRGLVAPPAGVNCRCTVAPITGLFAAEFQDRRGRPAFHQVFPFLDAQTAQYEERLDDAWTLLVERISREVEA